MLDITADVEAATLQRFNARQDRVAKDQGYGATVGALGVSSSCCASLAVAIKDDLAPITQSLSNKDRNWHLKGLSYVIRNIEPEVLAAATLSALLHSIAVGSDLRAASQYVGGAIRGECWSRKLLASNAKLHARIERSVRERHGSTKYREQAARSIASRAGFRAADWTKVELIQAGGFLIDCAMRALPDLFVMEEAGEDKRQFPQITPKGLELAECAIEDGLRRNPVFLPCVERPQPWTRFRAGGYWDERTRFSTSMVRAYHRETVAAIKTAMADGSMEPHVRAVNALQDVAWQINKPILDAVQWAYENDIAVKGVPPQQSMSEPGRLSDEDWNDEKKKRLHRIRISQVKEHNRGLVSNRVLFSQDVAIATKLVPQQFYTPFNCDWRGRVYAVPHFNFQRDDRARAMFLFANGMPIGERGLYWLKVHVVNCGQFDGVHKRPFEERVRWVDENLMKLRHVAMSPITMTELNLWTKADKPFLFLAACMELASAVSQGSSYVTRVPVSFDGSCSGLQHLCAMTRADEGSLVNLTPGELPQDVYQTVAELVAIRIAGDRDAGVEPTAAMASLCLSLGITRKLVKRNVMTYSYSSKKFGMSQQLLEDLMKPLALEVLEGKHEEHPYGEDDGHAAAKYLAGHIYAAIEQVVERPALAMAFLQKCARALAHEGKALAWRTPTGLPWINRYHEPILTRVKLWLSDVSVRVLVADGSKKDIDKDKAGNGVAPNFVHALDAAHLLLTTNAAVADGIANIATVHDSFGCLAPQADRFNQIIREQFVSMYETHDVLAEVLAASQRDLTDHNRRRLPELPAMGPLDIKEVLNAQFCFA